MLLKSLAFPILIILFAIVGTSFPHVFSSLVPLLPGLLAVVMLAMGLSLKPKNFSLVTQRPGKIALGLVLQFLIMPLISLGIGLAMELPPALLAGLVLVGCSPGGTASNVMAYIAGANLALSIVLTSVSSLMAVLLTPLIMHVLIGQIIEVDATAVLGSIALIIVALPVVIGCAINSAASERLDLVRRVFPVLSAMAILMIVAIVTAINRYHILTAGPDILIAVLGVCVSGFTLSYLLARLLGFDLYSARAVSIEVGMQNSALSATIALQFLSPVAAVPAALFSVAQNVIGALIASYWRKKGPEVVSGQTAPQPPAAE